MDDAAIQDALRDERVRRAMERAMRDVAIRREFDRLKGEGHTSTSAIRMLADREGVSEEAIRTVVYRKR